MMLARAALRGRGRRVAGAGALLAALTLGCDRAGRIGPARGAGGPRGAGRGRHRGAGAGARRAGGGAVRGGDGRRRQQRRPAGDGRARAAEGRRARGVRDLLRLGRRRDLGERQRLGPNRRSDAAALRGGAGAARDGAGGQGGRSAQGDAGRGLGPGAGFTRGPQPASHRVPPTAPVPSAGRVPLAARACRRRRLLRWSHVARGTGACGARGRSPFREHAREAAGAAPFPVRGGRRWRVAWDTRRGRWLGAHADARLVPIAVGRTAGGQRIRDERSLRRRQRRRLCARDEYRRDRRSWWCGKRWALSST